MVQSTQRAPREDATPPEQRGDGVPPEDAGIIEYEPLGGQRGRCQKPTSLTQIGRRCHPMIPSIRSMFRNWPHKAKVREFLWSMAPKNGQKHSIYTPRANRWEKTDMVRIACCKNGARAAYIHTFPPQASNTDMDKPAANPTRLDAQGAGGSAFVHIELVVVDKCRLLRHWQQKRASMPTQTQIKRALK